MQQYAEQILNKIPKAINKMLKPLFFWFRRFINMFAHLFFNPNKDNLCFQIKNINGKCLFFFKKSLMTKVQCEISIETLKSFKIRCCKISWTKIIMTLTKFTFLWRIFYDLRTIQNGKPDPFLKKLEHVDETKFGISVCTVDGQRFSIGKSFFCFKFGVKKF